MIVLGGLDGGGTKTLCALVDESGRVLALHASVTIVREAAKNLAEMVRAVARKLGVVENFELACVGGMFRDGELMLSALDEELRMFGLRCNLVGPELPPVGGALLIASTMLGVPSSSGFTARLKNSCYAYVMRQESVPSPSGFTARLKGGLSAAWTVTNRWFE